MNGSLGQGPEDPGRGRYPQAGIDDDSGQLFLPSARTPESQPRIVFPQCFQTHHNTVRFVAKFLDPEAGFPAADPGGIPTGCGNFSIQTQRSLDGKKRDAGPDEFGKTLVEPRTLLLQQADRHPDPGTPERLKTPAVDPRVGIGTAGENLPYPASDNLLHAGGCLPEMATRFQVHVQCGSDGLGAGIPEGHHLGVWSAGMIMVTLADALSLPDQKGPHHRIRAGPTSTPPSQVQTCPHETRLDLPFR